MIAIRPSETLLEICSRIEDDKALSLDGMPNKFLKVTVKSRLDILAELFETCSVE